MDPIKNYKLRVRAGVLPASDPTYMLTKYIMMLEDTNEELRKQITDQSDTDSETTENIRKPRTRRPYKKRVRTGEEVRGDTSSEEDPIMGED